MTAKLLKCCKGIILTVLFSLYMFVLYELAFIPAILEWSVYGVALVLSLTGLLIWSVPTVGRRQAAVLGITFLLAVRALDSIRSYPSVREFFSGLFIFILLLVIGKILGRFSIRRYFVVFMVAILLTSILDLSQTRLWTEFIVKWESPTLYKRLGTIDFFPVVLADVNGDGSKEIITQQNIKEAEEEKEKILESGTKYDILEKEGNNFAVYGWNGDTFTEFTPDRYNPEKLKAALPVDYQGYPFYETINRLNDSEGIEQQMNPLVKRAELVEKSTSFVSFPFEMLKLNQTNLESRLKSQAALSLPSPSSVVAEGNLVPGPPTEEVIIDHILSVRESGKDKQPLGTIDEKMVAEIGTSEVIVGDVDRDNTDELMLTSETSRILKIGKNGQWQVLWTSIDSLDEKARFQKFRFEDFAPLGKDKNPQIIALSKSYVRDNPTRYMTGYTYRDGALHQEWRVFTGLINLRAGDVDGDGENELVGYMYKAHRIFVLKRHHLPVTAAIYVITAGLIMLGFIRQRQHRKSLLSGGEQNA